jgi:hypothetical protein
MWILFFLGLLALPIQDANTVPKDKCAIEGVVMAAGDTPLGGVDVAILREGNPSSLMVTTDENGRYIAQGLEPGGYTILAQRRGYIPQQYGQRRYDREGIVLLLRAGTKLKEIDFRLIKTGVIAGRVIDDTGQPVIDAAVQAVSPYYVEGERRLIGGVEPTKTNDLGEYRIYGLGPNRYFVGVSGEDPDRSVITRPKNAAREVRRVPTLYPSVTEIEQATLIEVLPGKEVVGIDIVVSKKATFHIRGNVARINPAHKYTRVQLEAVGVGWEIGLRGSEIAPDAKGSFDFSGVTPGSYIVSTTLDGTGGSLSASQLVHVQDADLEGVSLAPDAIVVRGHVRVDATRKIEFRTLHLRLSCAYSDPIDGIVTSEGEFMLRGVGPYRYRVAVLGAEQFYVKSVRFGDSELRDRVLDFSPDGERSAAGTLEVLLSANGARIDGIVTDENGVAAPHAVVVLVPDSTHRHQTWLFKDTATDQGGHFNIHGIPPGNYTLFAWDDIEPGTWWDSDFLRRYEDKRQGITLDETGHVSVSLRIPPR